MKKEWFNVNEKKLSDIALSLTTYPTQKEITEINRKIKNLETQMKWRNWRCR